MRKPSHLLLLSCALLVPAGASLANGGGAGSPPPSVNVPDFDAAAEYRTGIEALQVKRYTEARKAFNRVLGVSPRDANTNYVAGLAAAGLDDLKGARKHFERAVKSDGNMVAAHEQLAITYAKLGERPKAEAELASLASLEAKCAQTCAEAKDIERAIASVTAALEAPAQARLETNPSLLFASAAAGDNAYFEAVGLINDGRYEAALSSLQAARRTFGPHPDVLTYIGFANRKLGRYEIAEDYYRQALAAAPTHKGATEYYGELMVERGDLDGARTMLARLDTLCSFGCAEADELRQWVEKGRSPAS
ncbi:MAG: tetratricopeptide repeat protein [Sphingosinicella sp.]|nr:tetratricopeptide repeat protein [Sphingosinicella sp.]